MGVDSYLEIFATMYGWTFSSIITRVMFDTGLYLLPVLFILISSLIEGHERGMDGEGVEWLVRKLEIQVYMTLFVFFLGVQSLSVASLSRISLQYVPPATAIDPSPIVATGGASDSTYGATFGDSADVAAIPVWWYLTMSLSSGVNGAVRAGIGSGMRDFRMIEDLAHIAGMPDARLRTEIQRFYSECFVPARSRYLRQEELSSEVQEAIALYGQADVDWIGSHAFRDDPALYGSLHARYDVPGFLYDPSRDTDISPTSAIIPTYGRPSCKEWWETGSIGLRARMVDYVGSFRGLRTKVTAVFTFASNEEVDDSLARLAMAKSAPNYINPEQIIGDDRSGVSKFMHGFADVFGALGAAWKGLEAAATMMPMITLITMAQPLILMGIYMFLPIIVMFSGYRLEILVTGALAIVTVKFWAVMWYIARWIDDHLIEAMNPDGFNLMEDIVNGMDGTYKRVVLNILLMLMYIGLPALWTGMMGWAGFRIGSSVSKVLNDAIDTGRSAGARGADAATRRR